MVDDSVNIVIIVSIFTMISVWFYLRARKEPRPVPQPGDAVARLNDVQWQTGDIILYHSNPFINITVSGEWSHVALVAVGKSNVPSIFEITGTDHYASVQPLYENVMGELVQAHRAVAYRRIYPPPDPAGLHKFIVQTLRKGVHYEHVYWRTFFERLFGGMFPIPISNSDRISNESTVCSALVAEALQYTGVLKRSRHSLRVLPHDFGNNTSTPLDLSSKYKLGPVTHLRI